jgi:hypothetical protein
VLAPVARVVIDLVAGVVLGRAIGLVAGVVLGRAIGLVAGVVLGRAIGLVGSVELGQAIGLVAGVVLGRAIGLVAGVVLGRAIGLVADVVLGPVLAQVAHLAGHESRVRLVAITTVLEVAHPPVGEQMVPVVEANSVAEAKILVQTAVDLLAWMGLQVPLRHPEVGAGIRRPKQRQMKLVVARPKRVAKTESDFRRYFRGSVSRRVVRLRTGFEPDVSVSTAS